VTPPPEQATPALSDGLVDQLARALADSPHGAAANLEDALRAICTEAHFRRLPPESVLLALKTAWRRVKQPPETADEEWSRGYFAALGRCLTTYFEAKR
jgi:hypothetical protein